jgi:hypothetical protein
VQYSSDGGEIIPVELAQDLLFHEIEVEIGVESSAETGQLGLLSS